MPAPITFIHAVAHALSITLGSTSVRFTHKTDTHGNDVSTSFSDARPNNDKEVTGMWESSPVAINGSFVGLIADETFLQISTQVLVIDDYDDPALVQIEPVISQSLNGAYTVQVTQLFIRNRVHIMSAARRMVFVGPYFSRFDN